MITDMVPAGTATTSLIDNLEYYRNQSRDLYERGMYAEAIDCFENIRTIDPEDVQNLFYLGWCYKHIGKHRSAVEALLAATRIDHRNSDLYVHLGEAYRLSKQYNLSINAYQNAIRMNAKKPFAYIGLANLHREIGDLTTAKDHIETAQTIAPLYGKVYLALAQVNESEGCYEEAVSNYEKALYMGVDVSSDFYRLGSHLLTIGNNSQAKALLEKSADLNPCDVNVLWNLGLAETRLGNLEKAIEHLETVIRISPGQRHAYPFLAYLYRKKNDWKGHWRTALRFLRNLPALFAFAWKESSGTE